MDSLLDLLQEDKNLTSIYNKNEVKLKFVQEEIDALRAEVAKNPSKELQRTLQMKESEGLNLYIVNNRLKEQIEKNRNRLKGEL